MIDSLAHSVTTVPAAAPTASAPDSTAFAGIADSISAPAADSIRPAADSIGLAADSIGLAPADTLFFADFRTAETETPSVWRDTTAAALFGEASVTVQPPRMQAAPPASLTENAAFQSFVLLLAAIYAMLLYRNLGDVRTLLDRISRDTATGQRLSEEPGGSGFSRFLNIATTIGMLFMGVMAVKYGGLLRRGPLPDDRGPSDGSRHALAALHLAARTAETHLFLPGRDRHLARAAAIRTLPPGHRKRLVLHHYHRIGRYGRSIPPGDTKSVYCQKNFDFALVFVPLHGGNLTNQPFVAAHGEMTLQQQT